MIPPINPATHQTIHPPMDGIVSTDFKSSKRIEISWLVQVLLNFYWFWGPPWGMRGGWMGVWGSAHAHAHVCTHTCMCIWHHRESLGFPKSNGGSHLQLKLSCLTCICAYVCMHMHMCGGTPQPPHTPIHAPSRAAGSPKHKNSISLELIEIFRFCVKILYPRTHIDYSWSPWTPPTYLPYPQEPRKPKLEKLQ